MGKIKHKWQVKAAREQAAPPGICVYVDNSNLFIEGGKLAEKRFNEDQFAFRIHFENFIRLIRRERTVREFVWGGSIPPPSDTVWKHLEGLGIKPDLLERASSGEQDTVDKSMQLRMHRHCRKYREAPGVIALCTGDGAGYYKEEGFLYDVEGFVEDGWRIELYSWQHCCHRKLREFAQKKGLFIPLEKFYHRVSFIETRRRAHPFDLNEVEQILGELRT